MISLLKIQIHRYRLGKRKKKENIENFCLTMEVMLYASSGLMPDVLVVMCFVDRLPRCYGVVAWFASDIGRLPRFRDGRVLDASSGRSDTVVKCGLSFFKAPDLGMVRRILGAFSEIMCSFHLLHSKYGKFLRFSKGF